MHLQLNFDRAWIVLQTEVSALSPRVAFLDHQRSLLTLGNNHRPRQAAAVLGALRCLSVAAAFMSHCVWNSTVESLNHWKPIGPSQRPALGR
jgi:hypothetical protein